MGVCSTELITTYPVALTVILCRINLYLEVALSGFELTQYIQRVRHEHARSVVWFSVALTALSICVMNIYDRKRLTGVRIAQLMNMQYAVVECKSPD